MGILFVNPARRGKKRRHVSGRGKVGRSGSKRSRKRKMPAGLAAYWAKKRTSKRKARRNPAKKRRGGTHKKRKTVMAKKKRRRARRGKRRTKRRSRRRARKRTGGGKRRRARRRRSGGKRRKARRKRSTKRRARRSRKRAGGKRRRPRRKKKATRRRRRRSAAKTRRMKTGPHGTLIMNPRHRRRRRKSRRRARRGRARRAAKRYGKRHFRKNPGGMLIDLAKRAAPVLIGLYGARLLVTKIGPKIPGVSKLGTMQSPLLAVGAVIAVNFATQKVGKLAKYRSELLLGTGLNALDAIISAFAPASVKAMIGVGDVYDRALGEYLHYGMGDYAEDPSRAMGEYVQMGEYVSMGDVEEELGVDEELGDVVEEELGDQTSWGEGVSTSSMLKPVPRTQMLEPVPTRSYLRPVPAATQAWDSPKSFYQGIFSGGAAGSAWDPGD